MIAVSVKINVAAVAQKPTTSAKTAEIYALNVRLKKSVRIAAKFVPIVLRLSAKTVALAPVAL